ncbi:type II secretion system F family protein [Marinobacter sp. SS21]|uniref:type II secretion system F family protein n=1 Tax=Marinobacter sp. SS21 TaxID=2979460 RepID=UPI00232F8E83|nr:type II secretion system F family protein [Marinobacter sp. SS21]MDC0663757.1 type II secretion system F family protein [Marinobacter sp. SS21]
MNWNISDEVIFVGMVFVAVFLLVQSFIIPVFGENRQAQKRLRKRLQAVARSADQDEPISLVRRKHLSQLSSFERALESLPGMERLEHLIEQAGQKTLAYRLVLKALIFGGAIGVLVGLLLSSMLVGLVVGVAMTTLPVFRLRRARANRLAKFEEQLPEALVVMSRALRAGHPFVDAMQLVADEMPDPIGAEFRTTFMEINYGGDVRNALNGLLGRIGSITVMVFVSSVLIQKETGGNLAELLENLASIIRSRFRFHRKLRTLSAPGRLAAWILSLQPFAMAGLLTVVSPNFLPMLTDNPIGRQLIVVAFVLTVAGIFWMRRIVRIDV